MVRHLLQRQEGSSLLSSRVHHLKGWQEVTRVLQHQLVIKLKYQTLMHNNNSISQFKKFQIG